MSMHPTDNQPTSIRPNLAAVPHPEEQGSVYRLRRNLIRTMRRRRIRPRSAIRSLIIEQLRIGRPRDPLTASHAETVIRGLGKAAGDRVLGQIQRLLSRLVKKTDKLRAIQASLRIRALYRPGDLVMHPDGGVQSAAMTAADQDAQRAQITSDIDRGSRRHRRLPAVLRHIPLVVFMADALLLLYFFAGVTDVDWSRPLSAALAFAALLAMMVTGISFAFFRFAGDRLHQYKDDTGTIPLRGLDEATNVATGLAIAAAAVIASLMYLRMHAEVLITLGSHSGITAFIVGLTLATVSLLANTLVVAIHAFDGSVETDRLHALGKAIAGPLSHQRRLLERAAILDPRIAALCREAERAATAGISQAGHQLAACDRIIDAARAIHQGTSPFSAPAVDPNAEEGTIGYRRTESSPQVDERPLLLARDHIRTPLTRLNQTIVEPSANEQEDEARAERKAA